MSDVLALARDPASWASRGHPEWGAFKLGHTHPEYSNSGLIFNATPAWVIQGVQLGQSRDQASR